MLPLSLTLRNLVNNERGNVLMTFGLTSIVAIAAVGGAVDFGRATQQKTLMQNALDAAGISGMMTYSDTNDWTKAKAVALATFRAEFPTAVAPTGAVPNPTAPIGVPLVSFTENGSTLSGTASMTASTPFIKLVTGSDLHVAAGNASDLNGAVMQNASSKMLEVAMMIDLTGSMGESRNGQSKIAGLKTASADIINILLPASGANNNAVRIGIAPFADYVNAGPYAAAVTGLAATGGAYSNISNLAWTKQGVFNGTYSGATGSSAGSQAGATPPTSATSAGGSGSTAGNGATYNNAYCANPTQTVTNTVTTTKTTQQFGTADIGTSANYGVSGSVNSPYYFQSNGTWYYVSHEGNTWYNYNQSRPYGYLYYQRNNGNWSRSDYNSYYNSHIPNTTTTTSTNVVTGCESNGTTTATSKLITCVTERTDSTNRYKDTVPGSANGYIGPYNAGSSNKYNYSSDGKCYTAGRELPAVIPLTNDRTALTSFFQNATIGGGTPGHLGTAWARYILSPDWSTIWPSTSAPAAYTNQGVLKVAILMTDGEYNEHYNGANSVTQAKAHCDAMKEQGVQIYSIGFGFGTNSKPSDGSTEGNAKAVLLYCATSPSHYMIPYDGAALRTAFQNIGTSLTTQMTSTEVKRGARIAN